MAKLASCIFDFEFSKTIGSVCRQRDPLYHSQIQAGFSDASFVTRTGFQQIRLLSNLALINLPYI